MNVSLALEASRLPARWAEEVGFKSTGHCSPQDNACRWQPWRPDWESLQPRAGEANLKQLIVIGNQVPRIRRFKPLLAAHASP